MKALLAKTGKTLKPSPTQWAWGAGRICFMVFRPLVREEEVDMAVVGFRLLRRRAMVRVVRPRVVRTIVESVCVGCVIE